MSTAGEIGRLLACCDTRFYWGSRNRAMLLVLLDRGVWRTELVDLDLEGRRLRVLHGKGNKQWVLRFGARAKEAVEDYLKRFRGGEPGPLFSSTSEEGEFSFGADLPEAAGGPGRSGEGEGAPLSPHVCDLGDRERGKGTGRAVPIGAQRAGDGAAVLATYDAEKAAQAHVLFSAADRLNGRHHGWQSCPCGVLQGSISP